MSDRKHVFISHHHADDAHVTKLTDLLARRGYEIRNSSIRAKPANKRRLEQGLVSDNAIKRLLSMKMSWASTVVVLIGKATHAREWVNWEIEKASALGKRIVGVYVQGGTEADVPPALEDHGTTTVNWNAESIIDAIEGGKDNTFLDPDGKPREPVHAGSKSNC
jgi:hypothetical protein